MLPVAWAPWVRYGRYGTWDKSHSHLPGQPALQRQVWGLKVGIIWSNQYLSFLWPPLWPLFFLFFCPSIPLEGFEIWSPIFSYFLIFLFFWALSTVLHTTYYYVLLLSVNFNLGLFVCHPTKVRSNNTFTSKQSLTLSIQEETGKGAIFVTRTTQPSFPLHHFHSFCLLPSAYPFSQSYGQEIFGWSLHLLLLLATLFKRRLNSHWLLPFRFIHTSQNKGRKSKNWSARGKKTDRSPPATCICTPARLHSCPHLLTLQPSNHLFATRLTRILDPFANETITSLPTSPLPATTIPQIPHDIV